MAVTSATNTNGSIGSSIISSLGTGSGIDSNKLADQLTEASTMVQSQRLDAKKTLLETQISDYGLLRSSLAKLETAAAALGSSDTFNAKSLSVPDTSLIGITKLDSKAAAGTYQLKIEQIAQAQSLSSSAEFDSMSSPIGKGTLTIRLGDWSGDPSTFNVDSTKTGGEIIIDETNNSLSGLRDAINAADLGVTASIVSNGGKFTLLMTSSTGAKNEIEISVAEDDASPGLSNFAFNGSGSGMTQLQEGLDAEVRINGLLVSRESNHITDIVDGMEFDLFGASTTETVSVTISEDKATAEQTIRDFVDAYNTFIDEVKLLTDFNEELDDYGSLNKDPLAKNLMQGIRNVLTSNIPGITEGFTSLSNVGIRTELDGSLSIHEEDNWGFRAAIDNNFEMVRDLFVPKASSSSSDISVSKYTARSQPGSYEVVITVPPAKGKLEGADATHPFPTELNTTGEDYSFTLKIDGTTTGEIKLPEGKNYTSASEIAADLQSLINLDSNIKTAKASVSVSFDGSKFVFTSAAYGATSNVEIVTASTKMGELGLGEGMGTSTAGKDVAGTVDGVEAFGSGNILLPAIGSKAEGLSMTVDPSVVAGSKSTLTFTRGFAGSMSSLVNEFLKTSGLISAREATITKDIERVENDEDALTRRSEAYRARLMAQFQAMETIVRSLSSTGDFLEGIADTLPFTSSNS